ncbi:MAG: DUF697 domain-containing protein [Pirellulales bacterium]
MPQRRSTIGFLLLAGVVALAYLLVTLPPTLITHYRDAAELGAYIGYAYLAVVTLGGSILLGLFGWFFWRLWRNTRARDESVDRRGRSPRELSRRERDAELDDNLAAGREFSTGAKISPQLRAEIERAVADLEAKRDARRIEIVAFGTISSGKSSLLNALAGRDLFRTDVVGGTTASRSEIPWPGHDQVILTDTPGLAEVTGEARAALAAQSAEDADLVLFVVDGPLKNYERDLLKVLATMEKRIVLCLNKEDWYDEPQRRELLAQIREQVAGLVVPQDVLAVHSRPIKRRRVRVLAGGQEEEEQITEPADITPLADRMVQIVEREGGDLLLANLLMQSRGLVDESKERVLAALDEEADRVITKYMWAAGGATAVNPIPLLDLAGGSAITVKMVLDLAHVYRQKINADTIVELLAQLGKNLIAMLGASAAAPALAATVGTVLKTVPGVGTVAGGLIQGLVQAVITRWIGRVFKAYFRNEMQPPPGGLAELARREWREVTSVDELRKLIQRGRKKLHGEEDY